MSGTRPGIPEGTLVLVGLGVANTAAARALAARGHPMVLTDDGDPEHGRTLASQLGCRFESRPDADALGEILRGSAALLATPGLPESHPAFGLARSSGVPTISEFDLAAAWDDRPLLAVTGTNGKTTVCTLTAAMIEASGIPCCAAGNLDLPLVEAIDDPAPRCFVVEASSFRLAHSRSFSPRVATWLNFAADHLDVHADLESYRAAKARIWSRQGPGDTAIYNLDDPVVAEAARAIPPGVRVQGFTLAAGGPRAPEGVGTYHEHDGVLVGPDGTELLRSEALWSRLPHDRSNVLAAAATAIAGGAHARGVREAALAFAGLPHRVELVGSRDGVRFYDDSKATTPHATLAALEGFDSVVLIAGGRNKGVDLSVLAGARNVVGVVGIGEAAQEVLEALSEVPGRVASDMRGAVREAAALASAGDVVLLSPGCASFDWYDSYAQRGEDFAAAVADHEGTRTAGAGGPNG